MFSYISINLRGRPVTSHEVLISTIGATTTAAGLTVRAELDRGVYPTGEKVHDKVMKQLPVERHEWHGEWNYDLRPAATPVEPEPIDGIFGMYKPGDKLPAWLAHPSITGLDAAAWRDLYERYMTYRDEHPPIALPNCGKPTVWTGTRKLSPTDHLLITILTQRWAVPRAVLAKLAGVRVETVRVALNQATADLANIEHTIVRGAITVTSAEQLASLAGHPSPS